MLTRPSDLSLTQTTSTSSSEPPIVGAEDTTLIPKETESTRLAFYERPDNDRRAVEKSRKQSDGHTEVLEKELMAGKGDVLEHPGGNQEEDAASIAGHGNGMQEEEEEEEEMTQERLQSLLEDINLEGGLDDVEMTEEGVKAILEQVRQAEKDVCSVPGWRSETSAAVVPSVAPGHGPDAAEGR